MRKDCRIWTCICGKKFLGRKALYGHRNRCKQHLIWRAEKPKRRQATIQDKLSKMTNEERSLYHKKLSDAQIKNRTPEKKKEASERTVFNNFWKYRSMNPIFYESQIAGKMKLDSKWELIVAKRLDDLGVCWYRPKIRLPYFDLDGIEHGYFPDFYVKDFNCFIEVKSQFIAKRQNSNNKVSYIKKHYKFVKWLETEEECKTFSLEDLHCNFLPKKESEDILIYIKEKQKIEKKTRKDLLREERWQLLQKSNINFSKFGWVKLAADLFGISSNKAGTYIRNNYPNFYKKCFQKHNLC